MAAKHNGIGKISEVEGSESEADDIKAGLS